MPLKQGQPVNVTCISAPSKPASKLILYKNEQIITKRPSLMIFYELDMRTKKNLTKLVFMIDDPDSSWDNARIKCEQIYQYANDFPKDISTRVQVHCKFILLKRSKYKPLKRILFNAERFENFALSMKIELDERKRENTMTHRVSLDQY